MAISDDQTWARQLTLRGPQEDDEAWGALLTLVDEVARRSVCGGSRFGAEDVVSLVLERTLRYRERDLAIVERGEMSMRALIVRLVRNSYADQARYHARACRATAGTMTDQSTDDNGHTGLTTNLHAPEREKPEEPEGPTLRLWSSVVTSDSFLAYQRGIQYIHTVGPHWRGSAPHYPVLLVTERNYMALKLRDMSSRGQVGGIPADGAAQIVPWSSAVGALPFKGGTVDSVMAQGPFDDDKQLAEVLGVKANTLQQWRNRAQAKVLAGQDGRWVRKHFPHWPNPDAVTKSRDERKAQV